MAFIIRQPSWQKRLRFGLLFRTWPFPYLLHRYEVVCPIEDGSTFCRGFWSKEAAERWISEYRRR